MWIVHASWMRTVRRDTRWACVNDTHGCVRARVDALTATEGGIKVFKVRITRAFRSESNVVESSKCTSMWLSELSTALHVAVLVLQVDLRTIVQDIGVVCENERPGACAVDIYAAFERGDFDFSPPVDTSTNFERSRNDGRGWSTWDGNIHRRYRRRTHRRRYLLALGAAQLFLGLRHPRDGDGVVFVIAIRGRRIFIHSCRSRSTFARSRRRWFTRRDLRRHNVFLVVVVYCLLRHKIVVIESLVYQWRGGIP
jgi:hypothetical protein